jgi:hypothetical protein
MLNSTYLVDLRLDKNQLYINTCDSNGNQIQCTDLEKAHWFKELEFSGIFGKQKFYRPVEGRPTQLQSFESFVFRRYKVKAPQCPICADKIERGLLTEHDNCTRLRKGLSIKTGLYLHNFGSELSSGQDLTQQYMNVDLPNFKLIEERPVDMQECIKLFEDGKLDFCADWPFSKSLKPESDALYK